MSSVSLDFLLAQKISEQRMYICINILWNVPRKVKFPTILICFPKSNENGEWCICQFSSVTTPSSSLSCRRFPSRSSKQCCGRRNSYTFPRGFDVPNGSSLRINGKIISFLTRVPIAYGFSMLCFKIYLIFMM